ncbi:MAG TPA: alpha/beta hydrolase [Caulobacteraceae bacterium]
MPPPVTEHTAKSARHTSGYLASGPEDGPPIIFVHGWPELSLSWRHQLPFFGKLGYRAIAPDMRGYGRSSVYSRHEDYALSESSADMVELLDHLGHEKAVWVGHDWGSPVVWTMASHRPERCHGIANLCVPYIPDGFAPANIIPLVDRAIYPKAEYPAGQWDYQLFYEENFDKARSTFEADCAATVKLLFRAGSEAGAGQPAATSMTRKNGGWFGPLTSAPDLPRDESVLTEADVEAYASALKRNGFFGPDSWYMNAERNIAFAKQARNGGRIDLPVFFVHAAYDWVCQTKTSRLAEPMYAACSYLSEATANTGHWMAQEDPAYVNRILARWLSDELAEVGPG